MKNKSNLVEYFSSEKNIYDLKWKSIFDLKKISEDFIAQGIVAYKDYIFYSIHERDQRSYILIFKQDKNGNLIFDRKVLMPLEATHTSDLDIYQDKLYAIDFESNFIYKFEIIDLNGVVDFNLIDKTKLSLGENKFGSFAITPKEDKVYLLATSFLKDNRIWVFDFEDLFKRKLGFEDSLIFETEASYYTQGLYYDKDEEVLYLSTNRFIRDYIFKIDFEKFILKKDIDEAVLEVYLAPGEMVEDIFVKNGVIYTSDEGVNRIFKASLKTGKKIKKDKNFDLSFYPYYQKIISHRNRVRGFQENTLDGIKNIIKTKVPLIEIDLRVSADGVFYCYHNPFFVDGFKVFRFYDKTFNEIQRERYKIYKQRITLFEDVLKYFANHRLENQKIVIDIKDYGVEEEIIELIEKYDLLDHFVIFTWTPQTILKLDKIFEKKKIKVPLYFSHVRTDSIFKYIFIPWFLNWKNYFVRILYFVLIGSKNYKTDLGKYSIGYSHVPYFSYIPQEIVDILKKYQGGVCVTTKSRIFPKIGSRYLRFWKSQGLKTVIFGPMFGIFEINKLKYFENLAKEDYIDYIFVDDLDIF